MLFPRKKPDGRYWQSYTAQIESKVTLTASPFHLIPDPWHKPYADPAIRAECHVRGINLWEFLPASRFFSSTTMTDGPEQNHVISLWIFIPHELPAESKVTLDFVHIGYDPCLHWSVRPKKFRHVPQTSIWILFLEDLFKSSITSDPLRELDTRVEQNNDVRCRGNLAQCVDKTFNRTLTQFIHRPLPTDPVEWYNHRSWFLSRNRIQVCKKDFSHNSFIVSYSTETMVI